MFGRFFSISRFSLCFSSLKASWSGSAMANISCGVLIAVCVLTAWSYSLEWLGQHLPASQKWGEIPELSADSAESSEHNESSEGLDGDTEDNCDFLTPHAPSFTSIITHFYLSTSLQAIAVQDVSLLISSPPPELSLS